MNAILVNLVSYKQVMNLVEEHEAMGYSLEPESFQNSLFT